MAEQGFLRGGGGGEGSTQASERRGSLRLPTGDQPPCFLFCSPMNGGGGGGPLTLLLLSTPVISQNYIFTTTCPKSVFILNPQWHCQSSKYFKCHIQWDVKPPLKISWSIKGNVENLNIYIDRFIWGHPFVCCLVTLYSTRLTCMSVSAICGIKFIKLTLYNIMCYKTVRVAYWAFKDIN